MNCAIKTYCVSGRMIVYLPVKENNQNKLWTSGSVTWVSCWLNVFIHPNVLSGRLSVFIHSDVLKWEALCCKAGGKKKKKGISLL